MTIAARLGGALDAPEEFEPRGNGRPDVSVVIPVAERPESLLDLYLEYSAPLRASGRRVEFVFVVEPWHRALTRPLAELRERGEPIRVLEMGHGMGETALFNTAASRCRAPIILTIPAYRRIEAASLPLLVDRVERGADLVVARRWPRKSSWLVRMQQRLLHLMLGRLDDDRIHDIGSGVRAMRSDLLQQLPVYGDFLRFFPLLAIREGFRVEEVPTPQHPQDAVTRLYGPVVYLHRLIDVLGLSFLVRFTEKPLRFFGLVGASLASSGIVVLLVLLAQKLGGQGIADRPLLLLGVLLFVLGVQVVALGLVGEIIVHLHASRRPSYRLAARRSDADPVGSGRA